MSDYFPPDLLLEILLKLPPKSLIRFTTVSKSWRAVITHPDFTAAHLSNPNHSPPPQLLLRRYDNSDKLEHYSLLNLNQTQTPPISINSLKEFEFPFKSQIGYFRIVGTCDGLVCLSDDFFANPAQPIIIWNPSVRKYVSLPETTINPKGPHVFALGFGSCVGNDYKVVRLVYRKKPDGFGFGFNVPPQVEVFSIKTGRWRKMRGVDVRIQVLEFMWSQVFLNGVVHWLGREYIDVNSSRSSILVFRVGDEVFDEMPLPNELVGEEVKNLCVSVIGESLGVVKYEREGDGGDYGWCDVWVMKGLWAKMYRIDLIGGMERVVAFLKSGEVLVASKGVEMVVYDLESKESKDLGIYGTTRSFYVDGFVESLVLFREDSGDVFEEMSLEGLSCCLG